MPDTQTASQAESRNQNTVRAVLRNELTWIAIIVVGAWGVIVGVVLPIQRLQIQQDNNTALILDIQKNLTDIAQIKEDHAVFKEQQKTQNNELDIILKKLGITQ